jgi:hypothetical protein
MDEITTNNIIKGEERMKKQEVIHNIRGRPGERASP